MWFFNKANKRTMINIGAGNWKRKGWETLDYNNGKYQFNPDFQYDLTSHELFPFPSESVDFFYSSHVFEHIKQNHFKHIFSEIYRCLKVGGVIRITVPDYDLAFNAYKAGSIKFFKKYPGETITEKFLDFFATDLKYKFDKINREPDYYTDQVSIASQQRKPGNHLNWWNYSKLERMLSDAGFKIIYRSSYQKSKYRQLRGKGRRTGFDSTHPEVSLFVEAVK